MGTEITQKMKLIVPAETKTAPGVMIHWDEGDGEWATPEDVLQILIERIAELREAGDCDEYEEVMRRLQGARLWLHARKERLKEG